MLWFPESVWYIIKFVIVFFLKCFNIIDYWDPQVEDWISKKVFILMFYNQFKAFLKAKLNWVSHFYSYVVGLQYCSQCHSFTVFNENTVL